MQIIQRGLLNTHSRYRNPGVFSSFLFSEQRSRVKRCILRVIHSFHPADATSSSVSCTRAFGSWRGLSARVAPSICHGQLLYAVYIKKRAVAFCGKTERIGEKRFQQVSGLYARWRAPESDLRTVCICASNPTAGDHLLLAVAESLETWGSRRNM